WKYRGGSNRRECHWRRRAAVGLLEGLWQPRQRDSRRVATPRGRHLIRGLCPGRGCGGRWHSTGSPLRDRARPRPPVADPTLAGDGGVGNVNIRGDVLGGTGSYTGRVISKYGGLGNITIGGSIIGTTTGSGVLFGPGSFGAVQIGQNVRGGSGAGSGFVNSGGA